jgi:hypothetical protein
MRHIDRGPRVTGAVQFITTTSVIPAQAGIQSTVGTDRNISWTPAFAGVTKEG